MKEGAKPAASSPPVTRLSYECVLETGFKSKAMLMQNDNNTVRRESWLVDNKTALEQIGNE